MSRILGFLLLMTIAGGCSEAPAEKMTLQDVEARLQEVNHWKSVTLQEAGEGRYTGTAVMNDGGTLNLTEVVVSGRLVDAKWENADGTGEGGSKSE